MGFKEVKRTVLDCLANGNFQHVVRGNIDSKNLLQCGDVTAEEVAGVIRRCRGNQHEESAHHQIAGLTVHILKPTGWYIKFYFIADGTMFISVHN